MWPRFFQKLSEGQICLSCSRTSSLTYVCVFVGGGVCVCGHVCRCVGVLQTANEMLHIWAKDAKRAKGAKDAKRAKNAKGDVLHHVSSRAPPSVSGLLGDTPTKQVCVTVGV